MTIRVEDLGYSEAVKALTREVERLRPALSAEAGQRLVEVVERAVYPVYLVPREDPARATPLAGEAAVTFESSERLVVLLAALRAWDGRSDLVLDGHVIEGTPVPRPRRPLRARVAEVLATLARWLFVVALLAGYAAALLYAPVRAQVERPEDLTRDERQLALALARVSVNEALDSEPDGELIAQVVLGRGETASERLTWLRQHSRCVAGPLTQDEAYARPGNCRWSRNLHPDGRRPRGWRRELDGHWSRTRGRWWTALERAVEYVRGDRAADICAEQPQSWDGVRYGAERVAPAGSGRRILDCEVPYTTDPGAPGLHNFAVTWGPAARALGARPVADAATDRGDS